MEVSAMSAPTDLPNKPNMGGARLVRLAEVSKAADALAAEQLGRSIKPSIDWAGSNVASSYSSCVPARDRLLDSDICPVSSSPLERKSSLLGFLGFILGVALTIVFSKLNFPVAEIPSQPPAGRIVELSSWAAPQPAISRLIVKASQGVSGEPAPLGLALHGLAEDASVVITGLLPGMSLSTGDPFGAHGWRVPAANLADAWIAPPENFVGSAYLVAELLLPDNKPADQQVIQIEWLPAISRAPALYENDQEGIAVSTLKTSQGSESSETSSKRNVPGERVSQNFSQDNTRKATHSQGRRRMAIEPAPWRGDGANFWINRRGSNNDSRRAPSAAGYARERMPLAKRFWE
jgi:hypothetical protein